MSTVEITDEEAAHVLHHAGRDGGWPPSTFYGSLLNLFGVADPENIARLAQGFPGYAAAVALLRAGQVAKLQQIAKG